MIESTFFGTIRRSPTAPNDWFLLNDAGHTSKGIAAIETTTTYVRVHLEAPAISVGAVSVTADESFILPPQVYAGASVAPTYFDVKFSIVGGTGYVNPRALSRSGANVWINGTTWIEDPA